jgi:hypothetical protein
MVGDTTSEKKSNRTKLKAVTTYLEDNEFIQLEQGAKTEHRTLSNYVKTKILGGQAV